MILKKIWNFPDLVGRWVLKIPFSRLKNIGCVGQTETGKFQIYFFDPFLTVKRFAFHHGLFSRDHRTDMISALSDMIREATKKKTPFFH